MSGGSLRTSAYLEEEKQWGPRQALHAGQGFGRLPLTPVLSGLKCPSLSAGVEAFLLAPVP